MKWNIVIDSSSDLTAADAKGDIGLDIVPLTIIVGEKEFRDDENLDVQSLLQAMKEEKRASSSACPSTEDFYSCFAKADNSICITMTGALSGTFNSARLAKEMLMEEHPEKRVHIIDSKATAGKMVLLKMKAEELIEKGLEFDVISNMLDEYCKNTNLVFALGGYDNLIKTGRMSVLAGIMATHLGIRAVAVGTPEGEIDVVKKPRGERSAIEVMVDIMKQKKPMKDQPVVISHCRNPIGARNAKALIMEKLDTDKVTILDCKGLTTFYTMEKGLIIGY
ncbi:MAG: DegV family protein [Oscillospiraceae bacterium]